MKKTIAVAAVSLLVSSAAFADTIINEKFAGDPLLNGWQIFGATNLFAWDAANKAVDVTWDSTQPNSYFYHPLGVTLTTNDSFCIQFDLQISNAVITGYGQQLVIGLLHWAEATNAYFSRTIDYPPNISPNIFEFDYYPAVTSGDYPQPDTISASIVDANAHYQWNSDYQSLLPGVTCHVMLLHYANSLGISGVIYTNGQVMSHFPLLNNYYPTNDDGSFTFDTLSITSYADDGYDDEDIFAQGSVANFSFATPLPVGLIQTSAAGQVNFASDTNWLYTLEQSSNFQNWSPAAPQIFGNGTNLILQATNRPADNMFYRVRADLP